MESPSMSPYLTLVAFMVSGVDILSEISNISISVLFFLFSSSSLFALHAAVLLFLCCLFMF